MATEYAEPAILDLDTIWSRIAQDSPETATRFIERLRETCSLLADMPQMGRKRDDLRAGIRMFVSHRGYAILYRETEGGVLIERVAAPRRDVEGMFGYGE